MPAPWCSAELRHTGQVYLPTCQRAKIGRVGEVSCGAAGAEGETLLGEEEMTREGKSERKERQEQRCTPVTPLTCMASRVLHPLCWVSAAGGPHSPHVGVPGLPCALQRGLQTCCQLGWGPAERLPMPSRCQPKLPAGSCHVMSASSWHRCCLKIAGKMQVLASCSCPMGTDVVL